MRKLMLVVTVAAPTLMLWQSKLLLIADRLLHIFGFCLGG